MTVNRESIRQLVRSQLLDEGFKIGDLSGVKPGDQIPLSWDLDDVHFVRTSRDGGAYTSDEKFQQDFPGGFPIRSAFAFQENAPQRDDSNYPSHLEDVLEALKGKKDTVYTILPQDMKAYISDGARIIARSIVDDIDQKMKDGKLPIEAKNARISIYVTPSSSQHVSDYVEELRQNLERYIGTRFAKRSKSAKLKFVSQAYEECALEIKSVFDSLFRTPGGAVYFYEPFSKKMYKDAVTAARENVISKIEANEKDPGKFPDQAIKAYKTIRKKINDCIKRINEFKAPDESSESFTSSDVDVNRSFSKIPASQAPKIKADQTIVDQFSNHLKFLGASVNPQGDLEVDLSDLTKEDVRGTSPYIIKRWTSWHKNRGVPQVLTFSDLIKDFEQKTSLNVPKWQKKIGSKPHFSISVVPAKQRRHVSDFVQADESSLPGFIHIAVIADDNMESGVTLREMRRAFDRMKNMPNPPIAIYGAPLLVIRAQKPREGRHETSYTGRRKAGLPVAAPLSNIPEDSALYKKIIDRLAAMGNTKFEVADQEEEEEDQDSELNR